MPRPRTVVVRRTPLVIDNIVEEEVMQDYGFTKGDLRRLFAVLRFPKLWVCQNGSRFLGETAFLLLLRRLRYDETQASNQLFSVANFEF